MLHTTPFPTRYGSRQRVSSYTEYQISARSCLPYLPIHAGTSEHSKSVIQRCDCPGTLSHADKSSGAFRKSQRAGASVLGLGRCWTRGCAQKYSGWSWRVLLLCLSLCRCPFRSARYCHIGFWSDHSGLPALFTPNLTQAPDVAHVQCAEASLHKPRDGNVEARPNAWIAPVGPRN